MAAHEFVVVGGGIAGVSVCEELLRQLVPKRGPDDVAQVLLVSASEQLKGITNLVRITDNLERFDVVERSLQDIAKEHGGRLKVVHGTVCGVDDTAKTVLLTDGRTFKFGKLCVCTGGRPKLIARHPLVFGVRDTESVAALRRKVGTARRVCVVGNGGIALEAVFGLDTCEVVWVMKHEYMGSTFFDASASRFFLSERVLGTSVETVAAKQATAPAKPAGPARPDDQDDKLSGVLTDAGGVDADAGAGVSTTDASTGASTGAGAGAGAGAGVGSPATASGDHANSGAGGDHAPLGHALGPCWVQELRASAPLGQRPSRRRRRGRDPSSDKSAHGAGAADGGRSGAARKRPRRSAPVRLVFDCDVVALHDEYRGWVQVGDGGVELPAAPPPDAAAWPLTVLLSDGSMQGCDLVISATGVTPCTGFMPTAYPRAPDGGLVVDKFMRTPVCDDVFVCGDACHLERPDCPDWFQMRLWSQARTMGLYTAQSMAGVLDDLEGGFAFELFAHATNLLGFKVVLLGLYNGQGLGPAYTQAIQRVVATDAGLVSDASAVAPSPVDADDAAPTSVEVHVRVSPGEEYIKLVLHHGRVRGALLVGETDLEETFENLILNKLNVGAMGLDLLDPTIDIEDYFD